MQNLNAANRNAGVGSASTFVDMKCCTTDACNEKCSPNTSCCERPDCDRPRTDLNVAKISQSSVCWDSNLMAKASAEICSCEPGRCQQNGLSCCVGCPGASLGLC